MQCINSEYIPLSYKTNTEYVRLLVLAGLIDSIGYVFNDCYEITQSSKTLADDILFLTRSVGFISSMEECNRINGTTYYRIKFSTSMIYICIHLNKMNH